MAWDMDDLTWNWNLNVHRGAMPTCDQTVTVGGKCYNAWDVNYVLYGWAASLCGLNPLAMEARIIVWKTAKGDLDRLPGAIKFADLGWFGLFSPLPVEAPPVGYPSCHPCPLTYSANLNSVWP